MSAKEYRPKPRDTSQVKLPQDVEALTELLARNTHENWAQQRMKDGWKWGGARDDARKLPPSLVDYEELPESEREYDRLTAIQTLKTILALGFRIEKA